MIAVRGEREKISDFIKDGDDNRFMGTSILQGKFFPIYLSDKDRLLPLHLSTHQNFSAKVQIHIPVENRITVACVMHGIYGRKVLR